jgi:hypothetical protein
MGGSGLARKNIEAEQPEVLRVRGDDSTHSRGPERRSELRIEDPFSAELMPVHPCEEQFCGFGGREGAPHFRRIPPEFSAPDRLRGTERMGESARISDHVDEFGEYLWGDSQRSIWLKDFAPENLVSQSVSGQLHQLKLNQESGVGSDHSCDRISESRSSSGEGNGRRTAPMERGFKSRNEVLGWSDKSFATGLFASVISSSCSGPSSRTSSARCFCASSRVTLCIRQTSHNRRKMRRKRRDTNKHEFGANFEVCR